jgi:hypothetical protein
MSEIEDFMKMFTPAMACKEHQVFTQDCAVCEVGSARDELVRTFWYITKFLENPKNPATAQQKVDHILEIATTMVGRYGKQP